MIRITEIPAPMWGKTAHDATLECPHGRNTWTVFGDDEARQQMARAMGPAHRNQVRCQCELEALPVGQTTP